MKFETNEPRFCKYCDEWKESMLFRSPNQCKSCFKIRNAEYIERTKEEKKIKDKAYNHSPERKVKKKEWSKQYRKENKERDKQYGKEYRLKHKDDIRDEKQETPEQTAKRKVRAKKYRENNKDKIRARMRIYEREYVKNRKLKDPQFKIRRSVTSSINKYLKLNGVIKDFSIKLSLPYTIKELKAHLESQFEPWMSWDNWGSYNVNTWDDDDSSTWVWNIDHIIPHSWFNYKSLNDQEFRECWDLTNLRPYSAKQNILDGNKR